MSGQNALASISKESLVPTVLSQRIREAGISTVRKSVEDHTLPSVSKVVEILGYKETAAAIVMQIERLGMMLNVSKPMMPEAVAETAKMVVDACRSAGVNVTFADIDIVFQRAMRGSYGKFYGGFGCADILAWFSDYFAEKTEEYVRYNCEQSRSYDSNTPRSAEIAKDRNIELHREAVRHYTEQINKNKNK